LVNILYYHILVFEGDNHILVQMLIEMNEHVQYIMKLKKLYALTFVPMILSKEFFFF